MKKLIFILPLLGATLFAAPSTPYVKDVYKADTNVTDNLNGAYKSVTMNVTTPVKPTYISPRTVQYNTTLNKLTSGSMYIDVVYPKATPSTSAVYIWERNRYEEKNGINDRLIKGLAVSQYQVSSIVNPDGSKTVRYSIPDLSPYTKKITIATCPNMKTQTQVECAYTITDILGFVNY